MESRKRRSMFHAKSVARFMQEWECRNGQRRFYWPPSFLPLPLLPLLRPFQRRVKNWQTKGALSPARSGTRAGLLLPPLSAETNFRAAHLGGGRGRGRERYREGGRERESGRRSGRRRRGLNANRKTLWRFKTEGIDSTASRNACRRIAAQRLIMYEWQSGRGRDDGARSAVTRESRRGQTLITTLQDRKATKAARLSGHSSTCQRRNECCLTAS